MSTKQREIQSGKVYRQIFDAEVDLVKALEDAEKTFAEGDRTNKFQASQEGVPLVKTEDRLGTGMLSERQATWAESFPNESFVENPVLYKHYSEEIRARMEPPVSNLASREVQALPDVLAPVKVGSNIIDRIADSRKQRHDASVEDMHQELGVVSSDMEPRIVSLGESLITRLAENDEIINEMMARIEKDENLIEYTEMELNDLWDAVVSQSVSRQHWIKELDTDLAGLEEERINRVRDIFKQYSKQLHKIAHMMAPDLQRLLDKETQMINQTVLSNRRAYADLYTRLMMSDIEREKRLHTQWRKRVDDWKKLHTEKACQRFREYMDSSIVIDPPGAKAVLEEMKHAQQELNQKRLDLVLTLKDLKPPTSTKTAVYKWNQQVTDISKEIDNLNQQYFNRLCKEYERVCQDCLEESDTVKKDLIDRGICTEARAQQVINEQCFPLVGKKQSQYESELAKMDNALESHNAYLLKQLKSLLKYCQGAAHVWDVHELGLAKQERALQEKLDQCRQKHDSENQDKEANLDITMDRMRQDSSENALKESLKKALAMLEKIKAGYTKFHEDQTVIVSDYPVMVEEELERYDGGVCKFFSVNRTHPDAKDEENPGTPVTVDSQDSKKKTKKSTPRSKKDDRSSPLPMAVKEVLSTTKGTTFYVLTVAGEDGAQPNDDGKGKLKIRGVGSLPRSLTNAMIMGQSAPQSPAEKPDYIKSADVPDSMINDVKQVIRMNFLDHLEDWMSQATDRSKNVVAAKTEELNSELDLRLHLHQPRSRRAEIDVHNVRAAELVMHSERVQRHCKGINQALSDLKQRFNQMTQEHNKLAEGFRADIEALESVFVNATKSAKLVSLSNQLQIEQDKYMEVIRASLRQFRQNLDDTLQMLRESNARFIKSFKLFSDGGNFCPEEIDDYRKKLEKMSQKIDSSEGFIMADLEGMESKRLEQAMKIAKEFEDRFKHHMIDLLFMEKIARWLTNTQVKIKAEVAESNSQAQKLSQFLNDLERRIDACQRPNLDKEETVTPTQLNDGLKAIFEAFNERSMYLKCLMNPAPRPSSVTLQGNPALGNRVGFTSDAVPAVSKPGKQPTEDPSVGVIRNILRTQKSRLKGVDGDIDEAPLQQTSVTVNHNLPPMEHPGGKKMSRGSRKSVAESRNSHKPGTSTNSIDTPKRTMSGVKELAMQSKFLTSLLYRSKGKGIDKKYYVFGEQPEEDEELYFLGRTKKILREALDGLLSAAEIYYRQKGTRPVTRPQALQEIFEQCADIVVQKLQSYHKQADEYHNQCVQELRAQLVRLEELVGEVPGCVIRELVQIAMDEAQQERNSMDTVFSNKMADWDNTKFDNQNELRPTLGHPNKADELSALCEQEESRHKDCLSGIESHNQSLRENTVKYGSSFIEKLAARSEQLLLQFDNILVVDDIEKGRVPQVKLPTSDLLRRHQNSLPLEDDPDKDRPPRGKNTWPGMPKNELVLQSPPVDDGIDKATPRRKRGFKAEDPLTASVTTAKTTQGHSSVISARDTAYQEYKQFFQKTLDNIKQQKESQIIAEDRWTDSWATSVEKVKQLY